MTEQVDDFEKQEWYFVVDEKAEGPYSLREIDVKFRTNELNSTQYVWRDGMSDWLPLYEVPKLKQILQDATNEITPEVQQQIEMLAKDVAVNSDDDDKGKDEVLEGQADGKQLEISDKKGADKDAEDDSNGLFYYNKEEGCYKVFDQVQKQWQSQPEKPSEDQIKLLQANQPAAEEVKDSIKETTPETEVKPLSEEDLKKREQKKLKRKRAAQNKKKKWFDARQNTFVYVQGLPLDITEDELMDFFKKCGVLKIDKQTGSRKVKIYRDENDLPKGDARICYENIESVEMAIEWLHDTEIRPGFRVIIEQAKFEQKGETYVPKEATKLEKVDMLRIKAEQEREKAWDEDELHDIGLKIVILEGFYTQEELSQAIASAPEGDEEALEQVQKNFFAQLEDELRAEIEAKVGPVTKIDFFGANRDREICKIRFKSALHAEQCVQLMDKRCFDYRELSCFFWDGKTDYRKARESNEQVQSRIHDFGSWLNNSDQQLPEELQLKKEIDLESQQLLETPTFGQKPSPMIEKRAEKQQLKQESKPSLMLQDQSAEEI